MRVRIGSFNVRRLGFASKDRFEKICDIIRGECIDIISFQEIFSEGKGLSAIKQYLPGWEFCFKEPKDSKGFLGDTRGEGYVIAWNTRKFKFASSMSSRGEKSFEPRIVNSPEDGLHVNGANVSAITRVPMYGCFVPVNGGFFEIRLINIHVFFGDKTTYDRRFEEYKILVEDIFPVVSMRRNGSYRPSYTVAMGDYNLNLFAPRGIEEDVSREPIIETPRFISSDNQTIVTVQNKLTTISTCDTEHANGKYSQNYDHFTYCVNELRNRGDWCSYDRVNAVKKYYNGDFDLYSSEISDHVPIVFDLYIGEEELRYDNNGYRKTN